MRVQLLSGVGLVACLSAACGGHSSSPTAPTAATPSSSAGQPIVSATVAQAIAQLGAAPASGLSTITIPCSGGGSVTMTPMSTGTPGPSGDFTTTSRMQFNNCVSGGVTMNGDPYLDSALSLSGTASATMTLTVTTTGAVRFDVNGQQGRMLDNCTTTMTIQGPITPGVLPPMTVSYSGTITWEQPLGSTPVTHACGPAQ